MKNRRANMFLIAGAAWMLLASCGGSGDPKPAGFDGPSTGDSVLKGQQRTAGGAASAAPLVAHDAAPQTQRLQPSAATPTSSAAQATAPGRFNPDGVESAQMASNLQRVADAPVDEKTCTRGGVACDETYEARLNFKLRGSVGQLFQEDREVHLDSEDVVQLPVVPAPVSVFIQSRPASKDMLQVRLEDRRGNPLYILPPLPAGAATSFGWTRTDDPGSAPLRLRLTARTGPGDHSVDYLVLPVIDAEWRASLQRLARGP